MKILKRPDTNWSYKHTCVQCSAELEIEKSDVKHTSYPGDFRESGYDVWEATCPICSVIINIPVNTMSKAVQVEIKQRLSRPNIETIFRRD